MHKSTRDALALSAALFLTAACAKSDKAATDSAAIAAADTTGAMAAPAPAPAAALNLADVAGKWNMTAVPESGADTTPTTLVLTANAGTSGWSYTFKNGLKVPVQAVAAGDSLMLTSDEYSSVRRKGVKVMTVGALRMKDGKLAGTLVAHYKVKTPDSVVMMRSEGVKAP
ncbi:MAG: hypothetical protein ABIP93_19375 [Gemmatimonadaceae bacterium]